MSEQPHHIVHFDLDSFFVAVEILLNPALKGKPVIVGGTSERGVVSTCSYEARKFGVHSAMPMKTAIRLCPEATVVKGHYQEYSKYSRMVAAIIHAKVPLVQQASIDEFYCDLTGMDKFFGVSQYARELREQIIKETGLPISGGLSSAKFISKLATNEAKPNGFLEVPHGKETAFLWPLGIEKIIGVGKQSEPRLRAMGLHTFKDIAHTPQSTLVMALGKWGEELWHKAHGKGSTTVNTEWEQKSMSRETTFHQNITANNLLHKELVHLTERNAYDLRQDNKITGCVAVKIRYENFETITRQETVDYTALDDVLIATVKAIFDKHYTPGRAVRLLGVRFSHLLEGGGMQTDLFNNANEKLELYKAVDSLKNKFGSNVLSKAVAMPRRKKKE